jgi:hypothetical protein
MKSLLSEAWRLQPFVPPFAFSAFFSPEDTLLCVCAADSARNLVHAGRPTRIAELTSGSGLVGFYLLGEAGSGKGETASNSTLLGLDIDPGAARIAEQNARSLGLTDHARFAVADMWSSDTVDLLRAEGVQLLVCNPPYVPEPPGQTMEVEAGAGPHGTAHLLRALELARELRPDALALSWCSLSDPVGIVTAAADAGYALVELFVAAIADGEYSGSVHDYLRSLDDCYINELPETLEMLASDGAARFGYLLFAGAFAAGREREAVSGKRNARLVRHLCESFAREGISGLGPELTNDAAVTVHRYILDRWDELQLRVMLHGVPARPALSTP